ncbi:MAG: hypothetical protein K6A23_03055 [Butyrivibrio sp.]|nr:hypothetical protein [Butyrivibrio sp.]
MKKSKVNAMAALFMSAVFITGCADGADNSTGNVEVIGTDEIADKDAVLNENSSSDSEEGQEESSESDSESSLQNMDPQELADSVLTGNDKYDGFLAGTEKVNYRATGDVGEYLTLADYLEVGESYSLSEIEQAIANNDFMVLTDPTVTTIDCGGDGEKELLIQLHFEREDYYDLTMIIKEINDELVLCYCQDSWSRCSVTVDGNGIITTSGSGGATVQSYDIAFVDGNGDYNFFYGMEDTGEPETYYVIDKGEAKEISFVDIDTDYFMVTSYWFDKDYNNRTYYYTYYLLDENYADITTDADFEASNPYNQLFTDAGVTVYTHDEIAQMISERAAEIGYTGQY